MSIPIILIDDNAADRYLISRSIQDSNFDCTIYEFEAGDEFLEALENSNELKSISVSDITPALIFLDINMPRLSGFEVLEKMQKMEQLKNHIVVLLITSSNNDHDKERTQQFSLVKELAAKPVDTETATRLIGTYYSNKK